MSFIIGWAFVLSFIAVGQPSRAATPADPAGEDFSREVSRKVFKPGQVVATLANGAVVIAHRVDSPAITVRGYVNAGGVYEGKWLGGGLSHLLEHLVAGGSNARRTERQNKELLQSLGNNSNAYTFPYHTAYFVNTTPENLDKAADLVCGWMLNATIPQAEFEREREVVQRELEKDQGEPAWVMYNLAQTTRYVVSPAKVPTIGYKEVIKSLTRDDVYSYYKLAYQPNNMTFVVVGNLDPDAMISAIKKQIKSFPAGREFSHAIEDEPPIISPRATVGLFPKLGETRMEIGFPTIRLTHPDLYALDLLASVLGQGDGAILSQEIRDRGMASVIGASNYTPHFVDGTFSVTFNTDPRDIFKAKAAILAAIEKVKTNGVGEAQLARAKKQLVSSSAMSHQTVDDIGDTMAIDFVTTGDPNFMKIYVDRINQVTDEQIKQVAVKWLDQSRLLTTVLFPSESFGEGGLPAAQRYLESDGNEKPTTQPVATVAEKPAELFRYEMADGTILLVKSIPSATVASVNIYALGGLLAEDGSNNGIGNLTMQSTGRATRNRGSEELARIGDELGGEVKLNSGNNTWNWGVSCLPKDMPKAVDLIVDLYKNPIFPSDDVRIMADRVASEIQSQDAHWFYQSLRYARAVYFEPDNNPYQYMPQGRSAIVGKLKADDVRDWHSRKMLKAPRVLAIFGKVDPNAAVAEAQKYFGKATLRPTMMDYPAKPGKAAPEGKPTISIRQVRVNPTDNPQAGVIVMFDSNTVLGDPGYESLVVAHTMASGYNYPTGYLFDTLRGQGLVYDVNSIVMPGVSYKTPGSFIVYAACEPANVDKVVDGILLNIARLQSNTKDLIPGWCDRAKQLISTAYSLDQETPAAQAENMALDELYGLGAGYHDDFVKRINKVTENDVRAISRELLKKCIITVTTPQPNKVSAKKGDRTYDSFPEIEMAPKGVSHDR